MDFIEEIKSRIKRGNSILFAKNSLFLQDLIEFINKQSHKVLILWSFELVEEAINELLKKYPMEKRPSIALEKVKLWAKGEIKMPEAKRAILDCHAFAKELTSKEDIALCHAVGQACSVVHSPTHAIGFPIYELTSIVYHYGIDNASSYLLDKKEYYLKRLLYWQENISNYDLKWADFIEKK